MLTYDAELELSRQLSARRLVLQELSETHSDPNPEQLAIIETGTRAAAELVEAYLPYIRSLASAIYSEARSHQSSYEDLVQEGSLAALKCCNAFDAEGKNGRRGVRFANYSGMAITKAMRRSLAAANTPLKVNISVIQESWRWAATRDELRSKLGREPTTAELEQETALDAEYIEDIPHRSTFIDLDNPDESSAAEQSTVESQIFDLEQKYVQQVGMLMTALRSALSEQIAVDIAVYAGLDRRYPRDDPHEFAEFLKIGIREANRRIELLRMVIVHPKYRARLARALSDLGYEQ